MLGRNNGKSSAGRIKVMHVVSRLDAGGLENGIVNLCNRMDRTAFEPSICCLNGAGPMAGRLKPDIRVFNLGFPDNGSLARPIALARFFSKFKPDIVHAHAWGQGSFYAVTASRLARVPIVVNGEHGDFFTRKHQIIAQKLLSHLCNTTLSVSESLKHEIASMLRLPLHGVQVIHNGVDGERFNGEHDDSYLRKEIADRWRVHISDDHVVVGCVGSLKPKKNQKMLLKALAEIVRCEPRRKIVVLLIGAGPDSGQLNHYVAENGLQRTAVLLGERDDVAGILSLVDISVSCSRTSIDGSSAKSTEGLSNVMLEAMSSGNVVVSTESVGAREIITDGKTGFLFSENNNVQLCSILVRLMDDSELRHTIGSEAQKFVRTNFSVDKMVLQYQELYLRLMGKTY